MRPRLPCLEDGAREGMCGSQRNRPCRTARGDGSSGRARLASPCAGRCRKALTSSARVTVALACLRSSPAGQRQALGASSCLHGSSSHLSSQATRTRREKTLSWRENHQEFSVTLASHRPPSAPSPASQSSPARQPPGRSTRKASLKKASRSGKWQADSKNSTASGVPVVAQELPVERDAERVVAVDELGGCRLPTGHRGEGRERVHL